MGEGVNGGQVRACIHPLRKAAYKFRNTLMSKSILVMCTPDDGPGASDCNPNGSPEFVNIPGHKRWQRLGIAVIPLDAPGPVVTLYPVHRAA